ANKSGLLSGKVIDDADEIIGIEIWGFPPYVIVEAVVRDSTSSKALKLATVQLKQSDNVVSQAQTSFSGKAFLSGNAGNNYTMKISLSGYTDIEKNIFIPEGGSSDTIKIFVSADKVKPKTANIDG